jgi:hypothetical protein
MNAEGTVSVRDRPVKRPASVNARRSGRAIWKILLLLLLLCVIGAGVAYQVVFAPRKSSEPYKMALAQVQQDKNLIEQIGGPIQDATWFPLGRVNTAEGSAYIDLIVKGPKGSASVHFDAERVDNKWRLKHVQAVPTGGRPINIDMGEASGLDVAPTFGGGGEKSSDEKGKTEPAPKPDLAPPSIDLKIPE